MLEKIEKLNSQSELKNIGLDEQSIEVTLSFLKMYNNLEDKSFLKELILNCLLS